MTLSVVVPTSARYAFTSGILRSEDATVQSASPIVVELRVKGKTSPVQIDPIGIAVRWGVVFGRCWDRSQVDVAGSVYFIRLVGEFASRLGGRCHDGGL